VYVAEYNPGSNLPKLTKTFRTSDMAARFYNMLATHFSPEYGYQNDVHDQPSTEEKAELEEALKSTLAKHAHKQQTKRKNSSDSEDTETKRVCSGM
jgi:hypothetical protein